MQFRFELSARTERTGSGCLSETEADGEEADGVSASSPTLGGGGACSLLCTLAPARLPKVSATSLLPALARSPQLVPTVSRVFPFAAVVQFCTQGIVFRSYPRHLMRWPCFQMTASVASLVRAEES